MLEIEAVVGACCRLLREMPIRPFPSRNYHPHHNTVVAGDGGPGRGGPGGHGCRQAVFLGRHGPGGCGRARNQTLLFLDLGLERGPV